jgi:hypothetical protein
MYASSSLVAVTMNTLQDDSCHLVETYFEGAGDAGCCRSPRETRLQCELHQACERICERTNLTGVCILEFRYNINNRKWVLLETMRGFGDRHRYPSRWASISCASLYDLLVHQVHHAPVEYPAGIRSRNFVLDGFNLISSVRYLQRGEGPTWFGDVGDFLTQPIRWVSGRERSDSFVGDDLRPALWECADLLLNVGRKLRGTRSPTGVAANSLFNSAGRRSPKFVSSRFRIVPSSLRGQP